MQFLQFAKHQETQYLMRFTRFVKFVSDMIQMPHPNFLSLSLRFQNLPQQWQSSMFTNLCLSIIALICQLRQYPQPPFQPIESGIKQFEKLKFIVGGREINDKVAGKSRSLFPFKLYLPKLHSVKVVKVGVFSVPYFPGFGLNVEIYR